MTAPNARPDVHEMQALARAAVRAPRRRRPRLSRAARLHLIDALSRWAGSGQALIAGIAIFVAVSAGRAYPLRAATWAILVLGALYLCRRMRKEFRVGEKIASRPFRWRANYTAALSVLSAAFGAGAVIAVPDTAPPEFAFQTIALLLAGCLGAGVLHAAHGRSAAAIGLPAMAFIFLSAWRAGGIELALYGVGGAAASGAAALLLFHRYFRQKAMRRFPRTGFVRREIGIDYGDAADAEAAAPGAVRA